MIQVNILLLVIILIVVLVAYSSTKYGKPKSISHFYRVENVCPALFIINPALQQIKAELMMINSWRDWPEKMLYPDGSWKIVPIYAFNHWCQPYCQQVPTLTHLLKQIPNLQTALFSRMAPATILEPHQGWAELSNRIIRCHLGVEINELGTSYVAVANERQYHEPGKWFAFDDSRMHYGCNLSSWSRTILIIDITRPSDIPKGISKVETSDGLINLITEIIGKPGIKS